MLPKVRNVALRSRCGVLALAIPITLFIPATAAAAFPAPSWPGPQVRTYVNLAKATSLTNWRTNYAVRFRLQQSSGSTVNAVNQAVASTSNCHDCGAIAIGFQVLLISKQNLAALNANNTANATSYACTRCATLAAAYQIIYAADPQQRLTHQAEQGLAQIRAKVEDLQYSRLDTDQIQSKADALANQAVAILQDSAGDTPAGGTSTFSPATNGSAVPAGLTENSQPVVDLFVKVKDPAG